MNKLLIILLCFISCCCYAQTNTESNTIKENYKASIDSIFRIDQAIRSRKYTKQSKIYRKLVKDSLSLSGRKLAKFTKAKKVVEQLIVQDKLNTKTLLNLIDKYGFPGKEKVGTYTHGKAVLIFLHYDYDIDNRLLKPVLDKALNDKKIEAFNYALILDRHLVHCSNKPPYYYQWNFCDFFKLSESQQKLVLERRKAIGLKPSRVKCSTFGKYRTM